MSANCTEPSRLMEPGKVMPSSWTIMPRNAIMEMRPCLISTARRRARPSWSSQNGPEGSIGPGSTPMSPLTIDLGGGLLAGGHEGDGRGGEESESELGHFRLCVCEGARVRRGGGRRGRG